MIANERHVSPQGEYFIFGFSNTFMNAYCVMILESNSYTFDFLSVFTGTVIQNPFFDDVGGRF